MTSVSYENIFSYFLGDITDANLASLNISDATELMTEYLHKTVAEPYVRRLFTTLTLNDEIQTISYEMYFATDDDADLDFVKLILSKGMLIKWLTPQVESKNLTLQFIGGKEQKWFSQSQHIAEMRGLLSDSRLELRRLICDRGYINNSYLEES